MVEERAAAGERRRGNWRSDMTWRSVRTNALNLGAKSGASYIISLGLLA